MRGETIIDHIYLPKVPSPRLEAKRNQDLSGHGEQETAGLVECLLAKTSEIANMDGRISLPWSQKINEAPRGGTRRGWGSMADSGVGVGIGMHRGRTCLSACQRPPCWLSG